MGEMERQRAAREIWVSRGHLWAYAGGTLVLCLLTFGIGVRVGHRGAAPVSAVAPILHAGDAQGDLVELVSRVESNALLGGGLSELSFPSALEAQQVEAAVPSEPLVVEAPVAVGLAPKIVTPHVKNAIPTGNFTLLLGQYSSMEEAERRLAEVTEKKIAARVATLHVDGQAVFWVCSGAFSNEGAAKYARRQLAIDRSGVEVRRVMRSH